MKLESFNIYDNPLPSYRSGIFYNTFSYPTKIAPESIAIYIATHTDPGDTVLDAFAGSGSTGLAALMCENPTDKMLELAESMGVTPKWGRRNAILYDISVYGSFAANVMAHAPNCDEFSRRAYEVLELAETRLHSPYSAFGPGGERGEIRHIVWSSVLKCPACGGEYDFYEGMVSRAPLQISRVGECPHCGSSVEVRREDYVKETYWDAWVGEEVTTRKRKPVLIYGESAGKKWCRSANSYDLESMALFENIELPANAPIKELSWGELYRSGYHEGIRYLHQFYTRRNFLVFATLWDLVDGLAECDSRIKDALKLWLLSYNETHSTLMTRVVAKKNAKDFVLTGAQSGVLYISNLPVEKNIIKGLKRKIGNFAKAFEYLSSCEGEVIVRNSSSTCMAESCDSVDYAFTDPPFGDFIPYSEVNQINELWLGRTTNIADEAIISPSQKKGIDEYAGFITTVLQEMFRVLKPGAFATVVYHASKAAVWNAFAKAIYESGFSLLEASYLDKKQQSFKQVVSDGSVRNDSLLLLSKVSENERLRIPERRLQKTTEVSAQLAYTRYINEKLLCGEEVMLDAGKAYEVFEKHAKRGK